MLRIDHVSLHSNLSDSNIVTLDEAKSSPDWSQWLESLHVEYFFPEEVQCIWSFG